MSVASIRRRVCGVLTLALPNVTGVVAQSTPPSEAFVRAWAGDTVLVRLLREGGRANADVVLAAARVSEARATRRGALGAFWPTLVGNAAGSTNQVAFGPNVVSFDAIRATADLSWEVDLFGRVRSVSRAAQFDLLAREADEAAMGAVVAAEIASAYVQLRATDESREVLASALASRERAVALARARLESGVASGTEVAQLTAQVGEARVRLIDVERQQELLENQLLALIGRQERDATRGLPLSELVNAWRGGPVVDGALSRRPDLLRAEAARRAAHVRASVGASDLLPRVTVSGQYGSQVAAANSLFSRSGEIYTAQVGLAVPLFFGGQRAAGLAAARARAAQADAQWEAATRNAQREARDAIVGVTSARRALEANDMQAGAWREAAGLVEQRYQAGLTSAFELLDAQRSLLNAELARVAARQSYLASLITWQRVTFVIPSDTSTPAATSHSKDPREHD